MSETSVKERVLEAIRELPQDVTNEDVMERVYFLQKIERGLRQAEAGQGVSHEQAMRQIKTWQK